MREIEEYISGVLGRVAFVIAAVSLIITLSILKTYSNKRDKCEKEHNVYQCKLIAVPKEVKNED